MSRLTAPSDSFLMGCPSNRHRPGSLCRGVADVDLAPATTTWTFITLRSSVRRGRTARRASTKPTLVGVAAVSLPPVSPSEPPARLRSTARKRDNFICPSQSDRRREPEENETNIRDFHQHVAVSRNRYKTDVGVQCSCWRTLIGSRQNPGNWPATQSKIGLRCSRRTFMLLTCCTNSARFRS